MGFHTHLHEPSIQIEDVTTLLVHEMFMRTHLVDERVEVHLLLRLDMLGLRLANRIAGEDIQGRSTSRLQESLMMRMWVDREVRDLIIEFHGKETGVTLVVEVVGMCMLESECSWY